MKYLIVSGDSFTCPWPDHKWKEWPDIVADKLDMQLINLARVGRGNEFIYSTLVDKIVKLGADKIGMVIAAWSGAERKDYWNDRWCIDAPENGNFEHFIMKSHRLFYSLQEMCKSLAIPYRQVQMIHFYKNLSVYNNGNESILNKEGVDANDEIKVLKTIIDSPYMDKIDDRYFIGWPGVDDLGGYTIQNKTNPNRLKELMISDKDTHPNALGHKKIAKHIYENINGRS